MVLLIGWGSSRAHAEETLPFLTLNFPPYSYPQGDKVVGASPEILNLVLKQLGYRALFTLMPWKRSEREAYAGRYAGVLSLTPSPKRRRALYFSSPISGIREVFYKHRTNPLTWEKLEDLRHLRIGASAGYNYAPGFMAAMENNLLDVSLVTSEAPDRQNLDRLQRQRIDLFICVQSLCEYLRKKHAPQYVDLDFIDRAVGPIRYLRIGFSKHWPGSASLRERFNVELNNLTRTGEIDRILAKYGVSGSLPADD
tara:strand:- start:9724 stop:10485 length:762 start_codon:yes stop_codon:yes gene_type:complete